MPDPMTLPEPEMPQESAAPMPNAPMPQAPMPDAPMPDAAPQAPSAGDAMSDTPALPAEEPKKQDEVHKIADDYVIPISDDAAKAWEKAGPDKFKKYAEQVASGMYPTFADQIAAGLPTRVLLDPYVQVAAQILGPMMTEPDWLDPKWSAALQGGVDPKTKRPVPMTLDEWRQHLMTNPSHDYGKTPQALDRANAFVNELHKQFGGQNLGGGE